jgi:hypothetical protein
LYRGRAWATLKLEVAPPDARGVDREPVPAIDSAEFGLDGPKVVQCLSTRFQVAQKIHAVTERFEDRENERFRDLIDLLLLREIVEDLSSLRDACIATFEARGKHGWPPQLSVRTPGPSPTVRWWGRCSFRLPMSTTRQMTSGPLSLRCESPARGQLAPHGAGTTPTYPLHFGH